MRHCQARRLLRVCRSQKSHQRLQLRDTSPAALSSLQASNQQVVDQIVKELDPQAHFVSYAPPKFVAFRQGIYLELSLNTHSADVRRRIAVQAGSHGFR